MLRTVLFWTHLVAGVVAGAIILVMSATGVALTYEKQVTNWADMRQFTPITAPASSHLSADSLFALASAAKGTMPSGLTLRADPTLPASASFGREGVLYLDPATGVVLGSGNKSVRDVFGWATGWHRWLAGEGPNREIGKAITGACNLAFLVLVLTGMVLWIPRVITWGRIKAVLFFRRGLAGKARDFNWHNVLGIWSAIPLVVIVASATVIGYPWASDLVFRVAGEAPPPRQAGGPPGGERQGPPPAGERGPTAARPDVGMAQTAPPTGRPVDAPPAPRAALGAMVAAATPMMPGWKTLSVQLPKPDAKTVSLTLDRGTGGQPQLRATVMLNAATGAIEKYQPFDSLTTGRQLRSILRFAHTGEVLGIAGQTLAGLVSLASVVLVVTGITLAIRRAARAIGRRGQARRPASVADATAAARG